MKTYKIIILEHIGESGNWEWYQIFRKDVIKTPKKAIEWYIKEMGLDKQDIFQQEDGYLYAEDDIRAIEYEI